MTETNVLLSVISCQDQNERGRHQRYYIELDVGGIKYGFSGRFSQLRANNKKWCRETAAAPAKFPSRYWFHNMKTPEKIQLRETELFEYYSMLMRSNEALDWIRRRCEQVGEENMTSRVRYTKPKGFRSNAAVAS